MIVSLEEKWPVSVEDYSADEALVVCYTLPEIFVNSSSFNYFRTHFLNVDGAHISLCGIQIKGVSVVREGAI